MVIPPQQRPPFPELLLNKVDIDGDGNADGVYLSTKELRTLLEWEAEERIAFENNVSIIESWDDASD